MEGEPAKQNRNKRGGAARAQHGMWGKSGEEASRTEQEKRGSSSSVPARAPSRKSRTFVSIDFCVVSYLSPECS